MRRPFLLCALLLLVVAVVARGRTGRRPEVVVLPEGPPPAEADDAWYDDTPTGEIPVQRHPDAEVTRISGTLDDVL